jgi:ComF family protein
MIECGMAALTFAQITNGLSLLGRWGLDWLIPPQCLTCRAEVALDSGLCVACWSKLSFIEPPFCEKLALPFPYDQGDGALSAAALAEPPLWNRARAALLFDDAARSLAHALKYRDRHEAGILMARLMRRAGADILTTTDGIVPVPLHRLRLWRRRYNQSAILARHIAKDSRKPFRPELLRRRRSTRAQTGLDLEERQRNVRGAFIVPEEHRPQVVGKSFILIDDVRTTGATLEACTKALKRAGAAQVDILTFALVHKPKRLHI